MTPERIAKIKNMLARRQPDLTVVTDSVHKGRNLAAILRTCDAVGVAAVHAVIADAEYHSFRGTAKGSNQWVEVLRYQSVVEPLEVLRNKDFQVVVAHLGEGSVNYKSIDFTRPTAVFLGSELEGVSAEVLAKADHTVIVPMVGMVESYNVSVAAGIILEEARCQRDKAGFYDHQRLSDADFARYYFRGAFARLALYCDERGLEYPPVDEDGYLLEPDKWHAALRAKTHD